MFLAAMDGSFNEAEVVGTLTRLVVPKLIWSHRF